MTKLETIIQEAHALSEGERGRLLDCLLQQTACEAERSEIATGQRGLAAWTESAYGEELVGVLSRIAP